MKHICTLGITLNDQDKKRLEAIGELTTYESPTSLEDFLDKTLVTPHVAFCTRQASINGPEIALQNIESFVAGRQQNIINKE